jgi:hypothetical protein
VQWPADVLGHHIVLAREYSRYDVIKTVEKALEPHPKRSFSIPGLDYGPHEGPVSISQDEFHPSGFGSI